jgi:hypothetical protein
MNKDHQALATYRRAWFLARTLGFFIAGRYLAMRGVPFEVAHRVLLFKAPPLAPKGVKTLSARVDLDQAQKEENLAHRSFPFRLTPKTRGIPGLMVIEC